jgi:hypothetical protein
MSMLPDRNALRANVQGLRNRSCACIATILLSICISAATAAEAEAVADGATTTRQYTFAWPFADSSALRPRGGMTQGPAVTLQNEPGVAWQGLREAGLSTYERDRRAILAMAGAYRTSFDFLETIGFINPYAPQRPYQSWATEYVYVAADSGRFISLQHIIVMFFKHQDGTSSEPMVVKHWRQDWRYEDTDLHVYVGHNKWQRQRVDSAEVAGKWSQAVFQVDDSPRYEALGEWRHLGNYSSWESAQTMRPLPRREFSVRKDYQVLYGRNRHTITPLGWVHEEDNLKLIHGSADAPLSAATVLARELGLNRYERIVGHDFSAGDEYWKKSGAFWREVRAAWERRFARLDSFTLRSNVDGRRMFAVMFGYADELVHGKPYDADAARQFIESTLTAFISVD